MDPSDGLAAGGGGGPPDENYIERLFPRCQPKQQQAAGHRRQLGGSLNRSNGRQQQQHHHHHHQRQQQQQIIQLQHQQPQPPPNKTKRRNRLKIQQHSRRELEARRNRIRANEDTDNTQRQHSTDSSDTEQLANGKRVGLRKSISANDQYQMNNNNSQRLLTAELMPATTSSVLPPTATINTPATIANRGGVKKTSKYTASQNLQQQLQRSSQSGQTPTAPIVSKTSDTTSSTTIDELTNNNNNKNSRDTDCTDSSRSATSATQLQSHASNQRSILKPQPDIRLGLVRDHERRGGTCRTSRGVVFGNQIDKMEAQANCTTQSPPPQPLTQPPSTVDEVGAAAPNSSSVADSNATIANTADLATQNKTIALKTDDADDKLLIEPATSEHVRTSNIDTKRGEQIEKEKNILDNQKDEDKYINLFVYDKAPLGYQTTKGAVELPQPEKTTKSGSSNSTDIKSSIESQQIEPTDQIIPDEGRAQQLLYSANRRHLLVDDDEEENTIKNDASIEELCSVNDSSDDTRKFLHNRVSKKTAGGDESACSRKSNLEPTAPSSVTTVTITTSNRNNHASHHRSSLGTTLQPVDEKAELNIDESLCSDNVENQQQITDKSELMTSIGDESAMHTTNNYNGQKKICVPPGFPQRVKPQVCVAPSSINHENTTRLSSPPSSPSPPSPPQAPNMNEPIVETNYRHLQASDDLIKKISKPERALDTQSDRQSVDACLINRNDLNYSTPFKVVGSENSDELISTNEAPLSPAIRFPSKRTEELHLPIISEGISELELDRKEQDADAELTGGLEKMSLTNRTVQQNQDFLNGTISEAPNTTSTMQPPPQQQQTTQLTREAPASKDMNEFNISKSTGFSQQSEQLTIDGNNFFNDSTPTTSLRHHRLPNETCHYSVMRSTTSNILNTPSPSTISSAPPRSSSLQFNTLSDGDSGSDDRPTIRHQIQNTSATTPSSTISPATTMKKPDYRSAGAMNSAQASSSSSKFDDDLVTPTTKTALIFPRLDEGLSSEAESCEDEVEDDDERAMEADVDADDDEDEEDDEDLDDDGDIKGPMESIVRGTQASQSTEDSFIRQQHTLKPQNRLINSLQQQQQQFSANSLANPTDTDLYQNKAPNYAGFIGHEASDQTSDIKSPNVYPSQNGQSNYWVGLSNQQQQQQQLSGAGTAPSSQLHPPYQQFAIPRNHQNVNTNHSSVSVPRATGSAFNREEAKVANRLSSDTDNETDRLLAPQRVDQLQKIPGTDMSSNNSANEVQHINSYSRQSANSREGSTHTDCEDRQHLSEKERQIRQAEDAVRDVKVATEVQLFVSTEKIIVLDDKHRKIVMDHSLRTISYIADIGDAIVLIVKKKNASVDTTHELARPISKTSCHVFESNESSTITKSISQAFQVAYAELLKANGAGDASNYLPKEVDYQEVLNSQEMSTAELEMFARKDNQREVIVPKEANEILGLSIVESGWGSVLPTAVIASLKQDGPAYRCKKLSVGDQILSINGISLVGLSLPECQEILRKTKRQRVARLSVVPCPITVEVKIKRPDTKYQLGFSVQNGVICSLLRGGIAERGGVRVGHRIMSINGTTVVGVPHDKIVTLLASSIGEIRMKTCLTSLYRHMLGEEKAVFL